MPNSGNLETLEILLASGEDGLVLRGLTGEESEPAILNGEVVLNLSEATNLKEIDLVFSGLAKVTWRDTSNHHHEHPLFYHDFSFLNPYSGSTPHAKTQQTHTLQAGRHLFPFSLHVPGTLPATLRTYSGTCVTEYKLKAVASRPGFGSTDWKARKIVRITRGFGPDAVEYNQTLEIENTWPGKVSYAFTLPHKAFAAGETIPVSVKFSPLAKGVQIVSLVTTIREHTTVHSKHSTFAEARDSTVIKYNFTTAQADDSNTVSNRGGNTPARVESTASLTSLNPNNNTYSGPSSPTAGYSTPPILEPMHPVASGSGSSSNVNLNGSGNGSNGNGLASGGNSLASRMRSYSLAQAGQREEEEDTEISTEIDVVIDIPLPVWTTPTHTVHPVFISHKIKWSAFIKNPDGHVSELRCALPIHILATSLAEEARLASAGSRNLLFGESGVLAHSDVPQVDLPSYQDHIMDRIANAETASYFSPSSGFTPTPWSGRSTPLATPNHSPPPSRPGSPTRRHTAPVGTLSVSSGLNGQSRHPYNPHSTIGASGHSSGSVTPLISPTELEEHPEDHRNWVDSELLGSLNMDQQPTPPGSNPSSRPGSRPSSRPSSRPPSRPASPDRDLGSPHPDPPSLNRASTSNSGFFHLHLPKPLRPLTAFSRNGSSSSLTQQNATINSSSTGNNHPSPSALSNALAAHAAKGGNTPQTYDTHTHTTMSNSPQGPSPISSSPIITSTSTSFANPPPSTSLQHNLSTSPSIRHPHHSHSHHHHHHHGIHSPSSEGVDFLSAVPSYDVAARGFLGGGVIPISTELPNYERDYTGEHPNVEPFKSTSSVGEEE